MLNFSTIKIIVAPHERNPKYRGSTNSQKLCRLLLYFLVSIFIDSKTMHCYIIILFEKIMPNPEKPTSMNNFKVGLKIDSIDIKMHVMHLKFSPFPLEL